MVENARSDLPAPAEDECNSSSLHCELQSDGFGSKNGIISSRSSAEDREKSDLDEKSDARSLPVAGSNAARYKLMSPARLPITRSPCLTIPPGLSPTSLLESPVLLSNIKAEPSPTTGTFSMPPVLHNIYGSNSLSSPSRETQNNSTCNTGCASNFEFKPDIRSTSSFGFPSQGTLVSSWPDYENVLISSQELMLPISPPNPTGTMSNSMANGTIEVLHGDLPLREGPDDVTLACDHKEPNSLVAVEKSSEDGYNWRKYGQKHVKGSEFPRSYYKCTHPNCQVKKQLERSHDGQITEIVYKGKHDHPKPQTNRRLAVNIASPNKAGERSDDISAIHSKDNTLLGQGRTSHQVDLSGTSDFSPFTASDDDIDGAGAWSIKNSGDFNDEDDQETKRRKTDCSAVDTTPLSKMTREPRVVVQTLSNVDILDDGYRWRKYGQKVVKGNPNPRSYYKCTNAGCPVRKHVERACHDPKAVITTYEGKHNHDVPSSSRISRNVATLDTSNSLGNDGHIPLHQYVRPEQIDVVSLDLGMGFCSSSEDRSDEKQLEQGTESEVQVGVPDYRKANLAPPVSSYYGSGNHGASVFKSGKDQVDNFSFSVPHLTSQ